MTVLLWGPPGEAVIAAVAHACERNGIACISADGDDFTTVDLKGDLTLRDGRRVSLQKISGVLVRPEECAASAPAILASQKLNAWAELTDARVLNRPSAAASNRSKPYQSRLIAESGFAVPDTLVTTNPDDVRRFWKMHTTVIYKSISGVRSIVAVLTTEDEGRLDDVSTCPTQFQQYIIGIDYRVHVVGKRVFACRIRSTAVDYRYAPLSGQATSIDAVSLDPRLEERCVSLARSLNLGLAGIDLRQDEDGNWWCFEVNTAPGFIWFEEQAGLPIADAVARELERACR